MKTLYVALLAVLIVIVIIFIIFGFKASITSSPNITNLSNTTNYSQPIVNNTTQPIIPANETQPIIKKNETNITLPPAVYENVSKKIIVTHYHDSLNYVCTSEYPNAESECLSIATMNCANSSQVVINHNYAVDGCCYWSCG